MSDEDNIEMMERIARGDPETEAKQREVEDRRRKRLAQIVREEKERLPQSIKEAIIDSLPKDADDILLNATLTDKLTEIVLPKAMQRLAQEERATGFKQQNEVDYRHMNHKLSFMLETTIHDMAVYLATIKQFPINDLLREPFVINDLISTCESWNRDLETLHATDQKYAVLQSVQYPLEKSDLSIWVQSIQNNQVLTSEWIERQRAALRRFLNE